MKTQSPQGVRDAGTAKNICGDEANHESYHVRTHRARWPRDDALSDEASNYRKVIFDSYLSAFGNSSIEVLRHQLAVRAHHCGRAIRNFFPADRDARILDLGCGYGALEYYAAQAGYANIRGVDRSVEQLDASRRLGIANIAQDDCFEMLAKEQPGSLDAIVSFDLIEHLPKEQVCDLAAAIAKALAPGGRWILHCPNAESPMGGRVRYGDFTHELAFTRLSLAQLLTSFRFSRVECFEDGPVVHGMTSAVRLVVWRIIRAALHVWLVAETGQTDGTPIFTQNLFCVAYK